MFRWVTEATYLVVIIYTIYEKWMWRWPLFNKLSRAVGSPDIRGTWKGALEFKKDFNGNPGKIDLYLSIDQTLSSVTIQSFVSTSKSYSVTAKIIKAPSGRFQLVYLYRSEAPHGNRDDNRPHDGGCVLDLIGSPVNELDGSYFTDRTGSGVIRLARCTTKLTETFDEASNIICK
jgi:hypothetical protein